MMCLATLAGSAVIAPAHKERDEPNEVMASFEVPALGVLAGARVGGMETAWTQVHAGIICDGQHCDIGTAASGLRSLAGWQANGGALQSHDDLPAYYWSTYGDLSRVYVPTAGAGGATSAPPVEVPPARPVDVREVVHAPRWMDWRTLLSAYGDWDVSVMERIIACESGGDANAISPGGQNWGAFQLNVVHGYSVDEMTDPVRSTALAHDVWLSQGYQAWSCY